MSGFAKDPDAVLDYTVDWSSWLATGETISSSTWVVPAGLTEDSDTNDDTTATVWVSGGTAQETYVLTNRVTTSSGRTDDRSFSIRVTER